MSKQQYRFDCKIHVFILFMSSTLLAQTDSKLILDKDYFASMRSASMGGAVSPVVNGVEAVYYNPAGIGGIHLGTGKQPVLRQLNFPYISYSMGNKFSEIRDELLPSSVSDSSKKEILNKYSGEKGYVRGSALFSLGLHRTMFVVSTDQQMAAYKNSDIVDESSSNLGSLTYQYQKRNMGGFGFSFVDKKESFYLGFFLAQHAIERSTGKFDYSQLDQYQDLISQNQDTYKVNSVNVGTLWVFNKVSFPSLSIVVNDVGNTLHTPINDSTNKLQVDENVTIGFSVSPKMGSKSYLNIVLEAYNLGHIYTSASTKTRSAIEYNYNGFGNDAVFSIRSGVNSGGSSMGISLNLSLIKFEYAVQSISSGINNDRINETRKMWLFSTNVVEY